MEIPDDIACLFSGRIDERSDSFVIDIPERELAQGELEAGEVYRIAIVARRTERDRKKSSSKEENRRAALKPPVTEGDQRLVEIEDIGEQGDGIARVERGYVVIVPDTSLGERVTIEVTDVRENVGFAEVIKREEYYE